MEAPCLSSEHAGAAADRDGVVVVREIGRLEDVLVAFAQHGPRVAWRAGPVTEDREPVVAQMVHRSARRGRPTPPLDDQHGRPRSGQNPRGDPTAGAAADDDDVVGVLGRPQLDRRDADRIRPIRGRFERERFVADRVPRPRVSQGGEDLLDGLRDCDHQPLLSGRKRCGAAASEDVERDGDLERFVERHDRALCLTGGEAAVDLVHLEADAVSLVGCVDALSSPGCVHVQVGGTVKERRDVDPTLGARDACPAGHADPDRRFDHAELTTRVMQNCCREFVDAGRTDGDVRGDAVGAAQHEGTQLDGVDAQVQGGASAEGRVEEPVLRVDVGAKPKSPSTRSGSPMRPSNSSSMRRW